MRLTGGGLKILIAMSVALLIGGCSPQRTRLAGKDGPSESIKQAEEIQRQQELPDPGLPSASAEAQTKSQREETVSSGSDSAGSPKTTLPLKAELKPSCGTQGTLMTLTIETRKTAQLSIAVVYSDTDPHGNYTVTNADDQGRYTYAWAIPPEAPMGDAQVMIAAGDYSPGPDEYSAYSNGETASDRLPFKVAAKC